MKFPKDGSLQVAGDFGGAGGADPSLDPDARGGCPDLPGLLPSTRRHAGGVERGAPGSTGLTGNGQGVVRHVRSN